MIPFVTFHNMALCYQKLSALEECSLCLEGALLNLDMALAPLVDRSASVAMQFKRLKIECKLHMQTCAILSQLHRHKEALKHARTGTKLAQKLIQKLVPLCSDYRQLVTGEADSAILKKLRYPRRDPLEQSISLMQRNSERLLPILRELTRRLVPEKPETSGGANSSLNSKKHKRKKSSASRLDMRNLLGFVNQNEWISNLNIGNIMQIAPLSVTELLTFTHNEVELTRDLILQKISLLVVSYFCVSTEIRFILQLKQDPSYDPAAKLKESEYWHAKSLEIVCSFLPSECPLLNHILLSYQKHHSPSQQTIPEDAQAEVGVAVLRPLQGIESQKFQPIIRSIQGLQFFLSPLPSPKGVFTEMDLEGSVHVVNDYEDESLMEVELDSDEQSEGRAGNSKKQQSQQQGLSERNLGSKTASLSKMEVAKQNKSHLDQADMAEDSLLENIVVKPSTALGKRRNSTGTEEATPQMRPFTQHARQEKRSLHGELRPASAKRKVQRQTPGKPSSLERAGALQFAGVSGIQGGFGKGGGGGKAAKKSSSFSRKSQLSLHQYEELKQKLISQYKAQKVLSAHIPEQKATGPPKPRGPLKQKVPASVASQALGGGGSFLAGGRGVASASNFLNKRNHIAFRVFSSSKSPNPPRAQQASQPVLGGGEKMNVSVIEAGAGDLFEMENQAVNRSFHLQDPKRHKSATPFPKKQPAAKNYRVLKFLKN